MKRPFRLNEVIELQNEQSFDEFVQRQDISGFNIEQRGVDAMRFTSKISLGIGSINNMIFQSISIYGTKEKVGNKVSLVLRNKLRIDAVLITILLLVMFFVVLYYQLVVGEPIPFWINLILFPIAIIFFNWIWYVQEKHLLKLIKMELSRLL